MRFDYLDEFLSLAHTLNFTKSADDLHLSQPTLSRHISELEHEMGTPLFNRTTHSVELTQAGRTFYEKASAMVFDFDKTVNEIKGAPKKKLDIVKVGGNTIQPTANRLLTKMAARAITDGLPIRIEYGKTRTLAGDGPTAMSLDLLASKKLDLIIEPLATDSEYLTEFDSFSLCCEKLIVFASSDNPLVHRRHLKLEDLNGCELITLALYQTCPALMIEPFLRTGFDTRRMTTAFVGNLLEMPEHIASLNDSQIIALKENFCAAYGLGQEGKHTTAALDVDDDRCRVTFWALTRKDEKSEPVLQAKRLLQDIVRGYQESAAADDRTDTGEVWSRVFYTDERATR